MIYKSKNTIKTSWNKVSDWYGNLVGDKGHYFHQNVIIPRSLRLLVIQPQSSILDVACGTGVFARFLPKTATYVGIDSSSELIKKAKEFDKNPTHSFLVGNVTSEIILQKHDFTHAVCMLALQNIKEAQKAILLVSKNIREHGRFLIVLNHPCFRIPRQSSWGIDEQNKLQYRRINRYMSPLEIPVNMHPSIPNSEVTWSFHHNLTDYSEYLYTAGFTIEKIEEWVSDKVSAGKAALMENRSREEFPLFLAILARKIKQ